MVIRGELEQVGTFNGNPLTMAAANVNLTEVLTQDAYGEFDRINTIFGGCNDVIDEHRLPASMKLLGAKGSIDWRPRRSTSTATCGRSTTGCRSWRGSGS